jgi:hypothetical protein
MTSSIRNRIVKLEVNEPRRKVILVDDGAGSAAREKARLHAAGELDDVKLYIVHTGVPRGEVTCR